MSLLPLVFLLNGLSVPTLDIDPASLPDALAEAQSIGLAQPDSCVRQAAAFMTPLSQPFTPNDQNPRLYSEKMRERLLLQNSRAQVQALIVQGSCYANQGLYPNALSSLTAAEDLATRNQLTELAFISLYRQIAILGLESDKQIQAHHAWSRLTTLLQEFRSNNDMLPVYISLMNCALAIHRQLPELAQKLLAQSRTLLLQRHDTNLEIWADMYEGDLLHLTNQDEHSLLAYHEAYEKAKINQLILPQIQLASKISDLFAINDDLPDAIRYAEQLMELTQDLGNDGWRADAIIRLAQLKRRAKDDHLALALLLNAAGVYQYVSHQPELARLNLEIGKTYQDLGRYDEAQSYLMAAYELFQRLNQAGFARASLLSLSELYLQKGLSTQAIVLLEQMQHHPIPEATPQQQTELFRLLSVAYEENQQYDLALQSYKQYAKNQLNELRTGPTSNNNFFKNYTQLDQSAQLKQLTTDKQTMEEELNWYLRVGISAALILTIMGLALLWHIRQRRVVLREKRKLQQSLEFEPITNMGTSALLKRQLETFELQTQQTEDSESQPEQTGTYFLLFRINALTSLECNVGIKRAHSILRQVAHALRQRMPEHCQFYLLSDRLILCSLPKNAGVTPDDVIVRIENRIGVIMRKYGLDEHVISGRVQYPFLSKSTNAVKPVQTLEICGLALAGAMQAAEKLGKNIWVELNAIDCQQAAFFNGELRTKTIDAIAKGLVKVKSSEKQPNIDWDALKPEQS
jgi:hypothetical protein